jgi:micrococcal nuclease
MRRILLAICLCLCTLPLPSLARAESAYFVLCGYHTPHDTCVYDGDTFWLRGISFRLEDFDTPEKKRPQCAEEAVLAADATRRLVELLNGGEFDLVRRGNRDRDRWGRRLRTVEIGGTSIATTMIAEGLARPWTGRREGWCGEP